MSSLTHTPAAQAIICGQRRFTCLSPTLIRLEYAPDGVFEARRSLMAASAQHPQPFTAVTADGAWDVLDTGRLQIRSCTHASPYNRLNLEIRWNDGRLTQFWRPGDRDYQNLGGTLRSLDRYGGECCALDGVHPATMDSPDASGSNWPAWLQCEVDPLYADLHPDPPENFNRGHWLREAQRPMNDGRYLEPVPKCSPLPVLSVASRLLVDEWRGKTPAPRCCTPDIDGML